MAQAQAEAQNSTENGGETRKLRGNVANLKPFQPGQPSANPGGVPRTAIELKKIHPRS
jgi:hypothetical protein